MKLLARIFVIPILFLGFFAVTSCEEDDDDPPASNEQIYNATLTGASEVPPNTSAATGSATLTYNDDTNVFKLTVTYAGMTPTVAHVHKGAVGQDGDPVFELTVTASPISYTSPALSAEQETDLKAGLYYVNVHSETYPGGEIRGQLLPKTNY